MPIALFSSGVDATLQDFAKRFQDFEKFLMILRLAAFSHLEETESALFHLQMELVELKKNEQKNRRKKFKDKENLLATWKGAIDFLMLQELAKKLSFFLEALMNEKAFSSMKYLKNKCRTRLLGGNLESELKLMVSRELPDFAKLSASKQYQGIY